MKFTHIAFTALAAAQLLLPRILAAVDHHDIVKIKEFANYLAELYPFLTDEEEVVARSGGGGQAAGFHQLNQDVHQFVSWSPDTPYIFDLTLTCQHHQTLLHAKSIRSTIIPNPKTFGKLIENYPGITALAESCGIPDYTHVVKLDDRLDSFGWLQKLGFFVERGVPCSITVHIVPRIRRPTDTQPYIFDLTLICPDQTTPILRAPISVAANPTVFGKLILKYQGFQEHVKSCGITRYTYLVQLNARPGFFAFGDKLGSFVQRDAHFSITVHVVRWSVGSERPTVVDTPFIFDLSLKCYGKEGRTLIDKQRKAVFEENPTNLGSLVRTYPDFRAIADRCGMPGHLYWIYVGDHYWYSSHGYGERQPLEGLVSRSSPVSITVFVMPHGTPKEDPKRVPMNFQPRDTPTLFPQHNALT